MAALLGVYESTISCDPKFMRKVKYLTTQAGGGEVSGIISNICLAAFLQWQSSLSKSGDKNLI
jgi:hypothetical protein